MARARHLRILPVMRTACKGEPQLICPLVSCRYHLLLDVAEDGRLLASREFDEDDAESIARALERMPATCALDVAARGGMTLEEVAAIMGINFQRVDQIASRACERLAEANERDDFEEREHPEDFYIRYSNMGAAELAELAAELRRKAKR